MDQVKVEVLEAEFVQTVIESLEPTRSFQRFQNLNPAPEPWGRLQGRGTCSTTCW